jgi:hypothetical protein
VQMTFLVRHKDVGPWIAITSHHFKPDGFADDTCSRTSVVKCGHLFQSAEVVRSGASMASWRCFTKS